MKNQWFFSSVFYEIHLDYVWPAIAIFSIFAIYLSLVDIKKGEVQRELCIIMMLLTLLARISVIFNVEFNPFTLHSIVIAPLAGGFVALIIYVLVMIITKGKIGLADIWFAIAMGFVLGIHGFIMSNLLACFLGLIFFGIIKLFNKEKKLKSLPFIPFLTIGFFISLLPLI